MMLFWSCAAALMVTALCFISSPKVRKNRGRGLLVLLWIAVPLLAVGLYERWGAAQAWIEYRDRQAGNVAYDAAFELAGFSSMSEVIDTLEAAVRENPHSARGWYLLGRSYLSEGDFDAASEAFATAYTLEPSDVEIVAEYAQALMLTQQGDISGKPLALLEEVLVLDAEHESALTMLGAHAFEQGEYAEAIEYWEALLARHGSGSETGQLLKEAIGRARLLMSGNS